MSDELKDLTNKEDEKLMELYQNGSDLAFNEIYRRYAGRIYSFFLKKAANASASQDLTQETFLKLHRSKNLYNKSLPFSPWLFSISRSVFLDFLKRKTKEDSTSPEEISKIVDQGVDSMSISNAASMDMNLLNILPATHGKVVSMRIIDEATFDEIASRLNTTPDNARQIFSRALRKLRDSFLRKEQK